MANLIGQFGIGTICILWLSLCVVVLRLWARVRFLEARSKQLQNEMDMLAERNLLLALNRKTEAPDSLPNSQLLKSESAESPPLRSPIVPLVSSTRGTGHKP